MIVRALTDYPDPLGVFERFLHLPYPILLDSGGLGGYTFAAADPVEVIRGSAGERTLELLRERLDWRGQREVVPGLPPFQGGAAGYVSYEYGRALETLPAPRVDDLQIPHALFGIYRWVVAWDHFERRCWVFAGDDGEAERVKSLIESPAAPVVSEISELQLCGDVKSNFTQPEYEQAVERVREYIRAGDIFQANLSQRFEADVAGHPWTLYKRLRENNPAPFASYFDFGDGVVISASPERFLKVDESGNVETRPIKGTRPRGTTAQSDTDLSLDLLASEKDKAEHVMIVDVLRNDLSRVCEYGSVSVPDLFRLEQYATVHHLVSTVTGKLRDSCDAVDLLNASFPGGSITGAPKIRAMEIIAELEPHARGVYCGAMGYVSNTGAMDTSIAIRTYLMRNGKVYFSAGGGIVADSVPSMEYQETLDKARALLEALNMKVSGHFAQRNEREQVKRPLTSI